MIVFRKLDKLDFVKLSQKVILINVQQTLNVSVESTLPSLSSDNFCIKVLLTSMIIASSLH